ncbi:MAG: YfiT family bacillithiol transferase [Candidatus Acidiferrales bacterium]
MAEDLRYPIGRWEKRASLDDATRRRFIDEIAAAPANFRKAVAGLNEQQLATPYREGGWTVRQVIHHVPESHMNSYCRFKWALTEDVPTIKTYEEQKWAETAEVQKTPVEVSLQLLESLHARWVGLLRAMTAGDFARRFKHPDLGEMNLDTLLSLYEWHGRHHVAHITSLRRRMGW